MLVSRVQANADSLRFCGGSCRFQSFLVVTISKGVFRARQRFCEGRRRGFRGLSISTLPDSPFLAFWDYLVFMGRSFLLTGKFYLLTVGLCCLRSIGLVFSTYGLIFFAYGGNRVRKKGSFGKGVFSEKSIF